MRFGLLLITLIGFALLIYFELGNMKQMLYLTRSPENPNNVNKQLNQIQKQTDMYNKSIDTLQTQTDDALKSLNK